METDIEYLLVTFSSLMGIPVRHYQQGKLLSFHSLIPLSYDPFLLEEEEVLSKKERIGYYLNDDDFYYCYLNQGDRTIVIGPTRNVPASEQVLKFVALRLSVPLEEIHTFTNQMSLLSTIPYKCVLESLAMLSYILTGEKIDKLSAYLSEGKKSEPKVRPSFEENASHSSYPVEQKILSLVRSGKEEDIDSYISSLPVFNTGIVSSESLRQNKNMFVATITLVSRAAIEEGVDINLALGLSDFYIRKCESLLTEKEIGTLYYQMVKDYTGRVHQKKMLSPLKYQIACYIEKHLDYPISLEELSESCSLSKSSLCLKFKEETGKTLNSFIHERKIEKSKELIRSGLSFSAISYYLGYSSQSHFTRMFEKVTGLSPLEFKKSLE